MRTKLTIVAAITLIGVWVAAQDVVTHYTGGYDLAKAKTFAIDVMTKWSNPQNEEYAKQAVVSQLTSRGYVQVTDPSSADLLVEIHGASKDKTSVHDFYTGTSMDNYAGFSGPAGVTPTWETEYKIGSGVVDIFDQKTKRLVFRGVGEDQISMKGHDQKKIDMAVEKMFKDFPRSKG